MDTSACDRHESWHLKYNLHAAMDLSWQLLTCALHTSAAKGAVADRQAGWCALGSNTRQGVVQGRVGVYGDPMQQVHTLYGSELAVWQCQGCLCLTLPAWHSSKKQRCTRSWAC
jgi:hypothetical protein